MSAEPRDRANAVAVLVNALREAGGYAPGVNVHSIAGAFLDAFDLANERTSGLAGSALARYIAPPSSDADKAYEAGRAVGLREGRDNLLREQLNAPSSDAGSPIDVERVKAIRLLMLDGIGTDLSSEFAQGSPFEPFDRIYVLKAITRVLDAARDRTRLAADEGPADPEEDTATPRPE